MWKGPAPPERCSLGLLRGWELSCPSEEGPLLQASGGSQERMWVSPGPVLLWAALGAGWALKLLGGAGHFCSVTPNAEASQLMCSVCCCHSMALNLYSSSEMRAAGQTSPPPTSQSCGKVKNTVHYWERKDIVSAVWDFIRSVQCSVSWQYGLGLNCVKGIQICQCMFVRDNNEHNAGGWTRANVTSEEGSCIKFWNVLMMSDVHQAPWSEGRWAMAITLH